MSSGPQQVNTLWTRVWTSLLAAGMGCIFLASLATTGWTTRLLGTSMLWGAGLATGLWVAILWGFPHALGFPDAPWGFSALQNVGEQLHGTFRQLHKQGLSTHLLVGLAVLIVGAAVRIQAIGFPIRYDEAFTVLHFTSQPLPEALSVYPYPNNHLFNTALVRMSRLLGGPDPTIVRLPALAAGLGVLPALYGVGQTLWNRRVGLLAMALGAFWPVLVLFSSTARGYSWVVLGFLVLMMLADKLRQQPAQPLLWGLWVLVGALGAYSIPLFLYPFGAVSCWLLLESWRQKEFWTLARPVLAAGLATALLTTLLYGPVLAREGLSALLGNQYVEALALDKFMAELPGFAGKLAVEWSAGLPVVLVGLVAGAALWGGWTVLSSKRRWWLVGMVGWSVVLLFLTRRAPFARIWIHLLPVGLLLAACGLERLHACLEQWELPAAGQWNRVFVWALLLALVGSSWVGLNRSVDRMPTIGHLAAGDQIVEYLEGRATPRDGLWGMLPSHMPLRFYLTHHSSLSPEILKRSPEPGGSLYLVVNDLHDQDLAAVAQDIGLPDHLVGRARVVFERPGVKMYRLHAGGK